MSSSLVKSVTVDWAEIPWSNRRPGARARVSLIWNLWGWGIMYLLRRGPRVDDDNIEISPLRAQNCVPAALLEA
jgi:hypothetical protein